VLTLTALWFWLPSLHRTPASSPLTELGALRRVHLWLALAVGMISMISISGMFAVYTYISTTLTDVARLHRSLVLLALMVFGLGRVAGNLLGGRMADKSVIRSLRLSLSALGAVLAVFVLASHNPWTALLVLFAIGPPLWITAGQDQQAKRLLDEDVEREYCGNNEIGDVDHLGDLEVYGN
jgi:DHA1 family inner membrane transport protein